MGVPEERLAKAKAKMQELFGPRGGEERGMLFDMAPKFAKLSREVLFGEVWCDPTLDTRSRELITLATLVALDRQPEIRLHSRAALNIGFSKDQIVALITHVGFYAGVPVAVNGLATVQQVFAKWDEVQARKT